jgi:hypothetical protein
VQKIVAGGGEVNREKFTDTFVFRLTVRRARIYSGAAVRSRLLLLAALLSLLPVSFAWCQAPLPILRGVVLTHSGEWRAYFEDPRTGGVAPYTVGDAVGDNRIEEIRDDVVVLRRGDDVVRIVMGSAPPAPTAIATESAPTVAAPIPPSMPAPMPVYRPNPTGGPTIDSGQPWLDRFGIPPQALSRAIEEALPSQHLESDNIKD